MTTTQQTGDPDDPLHELAHTGYDYDAAGNVLSINDSPQTSLGGYGADRQCFDYDWARRLTQAWTPASGDCSVGRSAGALGGADPYWKSYSYDTIGNRTSTVLHRASGQGGNLTSTYTQPAAGQGGPHATAKVTANNGSHVGTSVFGYDAAGNMTARQVAGQAAQALTWDREGELRSVAADDDRDGTVQADETHGYVYTADGDRLVRQQGKTTTVYLPGQELTVTAGNVTATRYYTFAGQTVAVRTGSGHEGVTTVFADHHHTGSIQIDNGTNNVVRRHLDPFGAPRDAAAGDPTSSSSTAGWTGDRGFIDKPADATGLNAIGARYYDPLLGAFISVDPVMDLTDPQQWHAYTYSNGNPTTWTDPTGMLPQFNTIPGAGGKVNPENRMVRSPSKATPPPPEPPIVDISDGTPEVSNGRDSNPDNCRRCKSSGSNISYKEAWEGLTHTLDSWLRSDELKTVLKIGSAVAGGVAMVGCIVASAGVCAIVGGAALVASGANNFTRAYRDPRFSGWEAAGNTAIDLTLGRIPGARAIRPRDIQNIGRHAPLSDFARRASVRPNFEFTLPARLALRHRPGTTVFRSSVHGVSGGMATTSNSWIE